MASTFGNKIRVAGRTLRLLCTSTSESALLPPIPYLPPSELLSHPPLQKLLLEQSITPTTPLTPTTQLSVLSNLSLHCRVPIPSNVLDQLDTTQRAVEWFSEQIKPCEARPHARHLITNTLGENVVERIDLQRQDVQAELETKIPSNLSLDERTFLKPEKRGVRMKKRYVASRQK